VSGGRYDYGQFYFSAVADGIERDIAKYRTPGKDECNEWAALSEEVISRMQKAVDTVMMAQKMVIRVDWLMSGDDGEDGFLRRWEEEGLDGEVKQ